MTPIAFLPWDDTKFLLQSQRDGYNHLYLFDTEGRELRQVTSGKWVVIDLVGFNKAKKSAIILSNEASPIQNNLYAVDLKSGRRTLLDNGRGMHAAYFGRGDKGGMLSASGKWLKMVKRHQIDSYSKIWKNMVLISTRLRAQI